MYALEFETDITSEYIRLPNYQDLKNKHVRVIVLTDQPANSTPVEEIATKNYDFSDLIGKLHWEGNALEEQQRLRDDW